MLGRLDDGRETACAKTQDCYEPHDCGQVAACCARSAASSRYAVEITICGWSCQPQSPRLIRLRHMLTSRWDLLTGVEMEEWSVIWRLPGAAQERDQVLVVAATSMSQALEEATKQLDDGAAITAIVGQGARGIRLLPED